MHYNLFVSFQSILYNILYLIVNNCVVNILYRQMFLSNLSHVSIEPNALKIIINVLNFLCKRLL